MAFLPLSRVILVTCLFIVNARPEDSDVQQIYKTVPKCHENEVFYKCKLEKCYRSCNDLTNPPPCPGLSPDCYEPACECKGDWLRDKDGLCIPYQKC